MRILSRLVSATPFLRFVSNISTTSILIAVSLLFATPQTLLAAEFTVCVSGCDYTSPELAVADVNTVLAGDTINVTTGNYVLGSTIQVDRSLTILGNDSVFDANGMRAISASGFTTNFSLTNVTLRNGQADPGTGGGAIWISGGARVIVVNVIFEDNLADFGGAVYNAGSGLGSDFVAVGSIFIGNKATSGKGGAVLTDGVGRSSLFQSIVDGNTASVAGGGVAVEGTLTRTELNQTTVSNNAALTSSLVIDNITGPLTPSTNCGLGPYGQTFLAGAEAISAFSYRIRVAGGGIGSDLIVSGLLRQDGPTGPLLATTTATIPAGLGVGAELVLVFELDHPIAMDPLGTYAIETEIVGNYSVVTTVAGGSYPDGQNYPCGVVLNPGSDYDFQIFGGTPGEGSGVHASLRGNAELLNSTVSNNVGEGVIAVADALVTAYFSTIANNSGNGVTAVPGIPGVSEAGVVQITASILAGNGGNDCNGEIDTNGYNLIGDGTNCVFSSVPNNPDMVGTDPLLGPLQFNGGPNETHEIDENSPAFNAAGLNSVGEPCNGFATDQRGNTRPSGGLCDIGAFEFVVPAGPLQTLIDNAAPGATIQVPAGTYNEQITIGDGKTLQGPQGTTSEALIDVIGLGVSAIVATGDFTLINIRVTGGDTTGNGGAIFANVAGTDINLIDVVILSCRAALDGGAIYLPDGTLNTTNTLFFSTSAGGNGGAIFAGAATIANLDKTRLSSTRATVSGGAIYNEGDLTTTEVTFVQTAAGDFGGGIFNSGAASLNIASSTFNNNDADNAGGAIAGSGTIEIRNSTLSGNSTLGNGGGIYLTGGTAVLNNVTLIANIATGLGGPFYGEVGSGALISLSNSLLFGNNGGGTNCATVASLGYNLFENAPCATQQSDIIGGAQIDVLANNGSQWTQTHALLPTSPAIDNGNPVPAFPQFDAVNFQFLQTQGGAQLDSGTLLLADQNSSVGSAFVSNSINPARSFSAEFEFEIVPNVSGLGASDGITFTISDDPTALGQGGGLLGIAVYDPLGGAIGVVNGVSVEFDTWLNGAAEGANDGGADEDHIGINVNGSLSSVALTFLGSRGALSDGNIWTAWIDYDFADKLLEVRAANNGIRPVAPTVSATVDIASLTGDTAYVGFTGAAANNNLSGEQRIVSFSFDIPCETTDQRGFMRPQGAGCDSGAYEAEVSPLVLGQVDISTNTNGSSYPGVTDVPIIDIPVEKLTGDTFNAPSSAPLGSFPLGSFPLGSFDLRASPLGSFPLGSFPLGSFPLGSFPLGSFPLSSLPLLTLGGWDEILNEIPTLAGAPLQTVTLEQLMTLNPLPESVASIELRDLSIDGSPLSSLSLPSLSLGDTTVADFDQWAQNADPASSSSICDTLDAADPGYGTCSDTDTLMSLEVKGAPVSALSLSSLPLGSFPLGSFPLGSFPIGSFPLGSFPLGSFPLGSFPLGSFPLGSFPLGSFPLGSFPLGSFNLLAAPLGSFPLGSFPLGSFPLGSFEIDDKSFCEFYDEKAIAGGSATCSALEINPATNSLADLVRALQETYPASNIGSTPLGSFPLGSFPIGSFPLGSFDLQTLATPPLSELTLAGIDGCTVIADNSSDTCLSLGLDDSSSLGDAANQYGGSLAASPLGSFPIGSFDVAGLPLGSFPLGSFDVNGAPLGSFPLGSFDIIGSPLGSFPLGSFPLGSFDLVIDDSAGNCDSCVTLADAARAGVISSSATLIDLELVPAFATTTLGEVLDAMTLSTLYCPPDPDPVSGPAVGCADTLGEIEDTGNLTLGQILIAMMLKTDFPWETIPLAQLDPQTFSADNFVDYLVDIELSGSGSSPVSVTATLADSFLYVKGSAVVDTFEDEIFNTTPINDPIIFEAGDGTQTLNFSMNLDGFTDNTLVFTTVPPLDLGEYPASATVMLGSDAPVDADASNSMLTIIPDPLTDISDPSMALVTPVNVLTLGFISSPNDNDFYEVKPPKAGDRVSVFMSNPAGDNDLIMYEPLSTVEAKGQSAESPPLDSVPFEDDGIDYRNNVSEEPNALEDVNLLNSPLASISTNRGGLDESVSAIAGDDAPFTIQVSGYNGAVSDEPYTLRTKVTPRVAAPQCTARSWVGSETSTVTPAGDWMADTTAVFLVNGSRLASSDPGGADAADDALSAINNLINAPGITNGVVVDVSGIFGVAGAYAAWDANPCDVDAANNIVNAITAYLEEQRLVSPNLAYVTIVGSDEVIPFARKPDETSIANESTFAGEFNDNALYGALVTRHFLSDDSYGDIDPIPWLDRYLNVPELGVGRLVESAVDIENAAQNYLAFGGVLDPQTALSAGYDFVADASEDIDDTFNNYGPVLGFSAEPALIDQPGVALALAWDRSDFLNAAGLNSTNPVDLVSFNMHFDFDEALPSSGDAGGDYTNNLISTADLDGADLLGGIWFTVGCHSGTNVPDVSVVAGAPSDDWAQAFSRLGSVYLAQNAFGLGDTEALALTERLMANFARNLNGSLTIGQAHAFAKQQYFASLGLYGEYDYKALQAATLFGLPMYRYGNGAMIIDPPELPLTISADPLSGLASASWPLPETGIGVEDTDKGKLFSVDGDVQFVHFRPLQPIVRRDVTNPDGSTASGAFLTGLVTEDVYVEDIAFARPVIDFGENEPEIETDEVVFPTAFTNIANYKAPPVGGGPFEPRDQLNVIVGQFTSPLDGKTDGTERLFRSFGSQVFYRPGSAASTASSGPIASPAFSGANASLAASGSDASLTASGSSAYSSDFIRPEFDNVQASLVQPGGTGPRQASFSIDVSDESPVLRVAVLYLESVTSGKGNWKLVDLVQGGGNTWSGGGPVQQSAVNDGQIDYMVQAVDSNGNVANSTFKGEFYVAEALPVAPEPDGNPGSIGVTLTIVEDGDVVVVPPGNWITSQPVAVTVTELDPETGYEYSVDYQAYQPLTDAGFQVFGDGVHIVTVREIGGGNSVTFVILVDTTDPQVVITTPADGEFITQGAATNAVFDCLDAGSGITTCEGTVPDGAPTPSGDEGTQSFVVSAVDHAGKGPVMDENVYYVVKPLEVDRPVDPTAIADPVSVSVSATDLAEFEETVTIDWGDGSPAELVDLSGGSVSAVVADHIYPKADVYQITVNVDYEGQFSQTSVIDLVVVYDAANGFVTGGGWFDSPTGAYTPSDSSDPDLTGKAHFGFVSKYKKGKSVPEGKTSFRFKNAGLKFEATSYDWMIISGARARYKGVGMVEGSDQLYKFQVTALDADVSGAGITQDGFRIKIWRAGSGDGENVLYDNGRGADDATGNGGTTPIGGGSIKVHKAKK